MLSIDINYGTIQIMRVYANLSSYIHKGRREGWIKTKQKKGFDKLHTFNINYIFWSS